MHGRITTLLIEDNPGDAVLIREMLLDLPDSLFVVQWADHLSKGLSRIGAGRIDIVLLDLNLPDSTGLDTFRTLHEAAPHLPVVVLSGNEDDNLALSAVREGADDYLVKGKVNGENLARCLRNTIERHAHRSRWHPGQQQQNSKGRVLCFIGAKGGVGTTTVALNVAAAISQRKHRVIALELRGHCGTLSHHFGFQLHKENLSALLKLEPGQINESELSARLSRYSPEFRILFGPQKAREAGHVPGEHAKAIIDTLSRMAQFVVVDLPSEPSGANKEAIRSSDFTGIVVEREPTCLASARTMLEHVEEWRSEALLGIVVVNRIPLAAPVDLDEIVARLKLGIVGLIPPDPDACILAQTVGTPVISTHDNTLLADSFGELAARLSETPIMIRKTA